MKKILVSLIAGILFVIVGTFLITPLFNDFYVSYKKLEPGPDTETILLDLLVFVQWPVYFIVGILSGYLLYIFTLTKSSKVTPKSGAL
jgi:hypothetical protein